MAWSVITLDGVKKVLSDIQYQNQVDNGVEYADEEQISNDSQSASNEMKANIFSEREKAIKGESKLADYLMSASKFIAPESYKETMLEGTPEMTIAVGREPNQTMSIPIPSMTNLKEIGPTAAGMALGGGAGFLASKVLPTAAKAIPLAQRTLASGSKVARGALEVGAKKLGQNVIGAEAEQLGSDVASMALGEDNSFNVEDYLINAGIGGGVTAFNQIGPVAKKALVTKLMSTDQFKNESEALQRVKQAFQNKSNEATMSSPKNWLANERDQTIAQLTNEYDDIVRQSNELVSVRGPEAYNAQVMLQNQAKVIKDQIKNVSIHYNDRITNFDKNSYAALGEAQKMSSSYLEGANKPKGYNKQTLKMYEKVDAPTTGISQEIDRMKRSGEKLAPPQGNYRQYEGFSPLQYGLEQITNPKGLNWLSNVGYKQRINPMVAPVGIGLTDYLIGE